MSSPPNITATLLEARAALDRQRAALDAAIAAAQGGGAAGTAGLENGRADDGLPSTEEEPMYSWVSTKPYPHHKAYRVWFKGIDGSKDYESFSSEAEAKAWIDAALPLVVKDGRPIEDVIEGFVASQTKLRPSSRTTLRYRLRAIIKGRERLPIEVFPWAQAWKAHVEPQSGDSQHGILAALHGLVAFAKLRGEPLKVLQVSKVKNEGKPQLRITEAKAFLTTAIAAGDSLAIAAATMAVTGLRPGEVMALQARDCDDGASVIWVERGKTRKARRTIEVEPAFRPVLARMTKGKAAGDLLFSYEGHRRRQNTNVAKARTDALLRRVRQLCEEANVPQVVSHSMRGLNATLRALGGSSHQGIADALGHESFRTTTRHYLDPAAAELSDSRRSHGRLLGAA